MRRTVVLIIITALLSTACGGSSGTGPTTSVGVTTTTSDLDGTIAPPDTSTSTTLPLPEFANVDEAISYVFDFDPANGSAEAIAMAMAMIGGHFPGSPIPAYLEFGSPEVVQALVKALGRPLAANAQILVAMGIYGPPSTDFEPQRRWNPVTRVGITTALETASTIYGANSEVAIAIIRELLAAELQGCPQGGCWDGAWYDVPRVVNRVTGVVDGNTFVGTVEVRNANGSRDSLPVTMEKVVGTWVAVEGFLAEGRAPALVVTSPPDGVYMLERIIAIEGVSEEGATVSAGGQSSPTEFGQFFDIAYELASGRNEILVSATNESGLSSEVTLTLFYDPAVEVRIALILSVTKDSVTVDPVELLFGEEAIAAAIAAGDLAEGETLPDGWYVSNPESEAIVLPTDTAARTILFTRDLETELVDLAGFATVLTRGDTGLYYGSLSDPFSLLILNGRVVQIEQAFLPGLD